ncbi:unnamed protein product [Cyprideis torosa]|uniref:Uncharacterized protein n=1 Tax=Cyprideis torosa TaxID=163714 RepID=A0A7R8W5T5_9CRUS|nr:unnamed protein product [Cyprideis torosa]CAG0883249.1 unnamed protein product [Cyprideis torosa]
MSGTTDLSAAFGEHKMHLTETVMQGFKLAKVFRDNHERINCIDFAEDGELLVTSSDDDQINIYDCVKGVHKRCVNSKKYGVDLIHFTHARNTAIHASNKIDDTIRYLSLHDNKYIRYFVGHSKRVTTLCMSPIDDSFLSGSLDKTVRLWDLRSNNCQGMVNIPTTGKPVAAFDPEGLIFALGINSDTVKLYDLRSFDKGPFAAFKLAPDRHCEWTALKFSPDGKLVMITTNSSTIRLIEAFNGQPLQTLTGHLNNRGGIFEASFSPDSKFVLSGSLDGKIHVWNAETGAKLPHCLGSELPGPVHCLQFNPKFMMLATACTATQTASDTMQGQMGFWLPSAEE